MENQDNISMKLKEIVKKIYPQYDNAYAFRTKKGRYVFGYTNDYPLQHGDGSRNEVDETMANFIIRGSFIL